jgi:hypothetical protein
MSPIGLYQELPMSTPDIALVIRVCADPICMPGSTFTYIDRNFPSIVCQEIHLAYLLPSIFGLYRAYRQLGILGDFSGERYHVSDKNMYDRWTTVAIALCIHVYAERFVYTERRYMYICRSRVFWVFYAEHYAWHICYQALFGILPSIGRSTY